MIKLYGNHKILTLLQNAHNTNSIASTYLFYGPEGIGKEAVALKFAAMVNELDEDKWLNSENIIYLHKLPANKSTKKSDDIYDTYPADVVEHIKDELQKKQLNAYHKVEIPNANQIRVDSIRILKKKLSTSNSGGRRFVIVSGADTMNNAAANSFLKTLEEPNPNTTIILIAENINSMLQTILSRSQKIKFTPLANEGIVEYLDDHYSEIDDEKKAIITSFAQGSIASAIQYVDEDLSGIVNSSVDLLRACLQRSGYRTLLMDRVEQLTKQRDKNLIINTLKLLQKWLQDAMHLHYGEDKLIVNRSEVNSIKKFVNYYNDINYPEVFDLIEKAIVRVNRNVTPDLLLVDLFLSIRKELLTGR